LIASLRGKSEEDFILFLLIVTLLLIPDLGFGSLVRLEGMPIAFILKVALAYVMALYVILPAILIIHGRRKEGGLLSSFLVGLMPFLVHTSYKILRGFFLVGALIDHIVYGDYIILGLLAGLIGASANLCNRSRKLGLLLLIVMLSAWTLMRILPLIVTHFVPSPPSGMPPPPPVGPALGA
jgi:hypothetical protein